MEGNGSDFFKQSIVANNQDSLCSMIKPESSQSESQSSTYEECLPEFQNGSKNRFEQLGCIDSENLQEGHGVSQPEDMIENLENIVLGFLSQLQGGDSEQEDAENSSSATPSIRIPIVDRKRLGKENTERDAPLRYVTFPRRKSSNTRNLAAMFRVIDLAHEALVSETTTTKRDIYYKDVKLFQRQTTVDQIVEDLSATCGCRRSDLNIRAASKGLFSGSAISIVLHQGGRITGSDVEATLIPSDAEIMRLEIKRRLAWVLVVEKEAVFQTLCRSGLTRSQHVPGSGIIITGKGYPDVATRELLSTLSRDLPKTVPLLALVDADPHGLDILSVYKHGSASMAHVKKNLRAPRLTWIGVSLGELQSLNIQPEELLPMTAQDQKKALKMLERTEGTMPVSWKRELMHMIHSRRKAEIEIVTSAVLPGSYFGDGMDNSQAHLTGPMLLVRYVADKIKTALLDISRNSPSDDMAQ